MTEAEWLMSSFPGPLLTHLGAGASRRKLRLCACALAYDVWHLLADPRSELAVQVGEAFADGAADLAALRAAHAGAVAARAAIEPSPGRRHQRGRRSRFGDWTARRAADVARIAADPRLELRDLLDVMRWERPAVLFAGTGYLRDLFGNPFRPAPFDPRWRTADVIGLARAVYEDRAFDRLPLLADALMEAGCEDGDIVGHCGSDGPHVRGCWAVDLVLGKE